MPLIQILSSKQQAEYENPPVFSAKQRKHFFKLPASLQTKVHSFRSLPNKIGFRLMFGYFLATKRFYSPEDFQQKDLRFLCKQYGMMFFAFDAQIYKQSTYTRHRQTILEHFAFQSYQAQVHNTMVKLAIKEQIYSWEANTFIVAYILEWLEGQHIELPSYYNLQLIFSQSIRKRNDEIKQKFTQLLQVSHRQILNRLLEKTTEGTKQEYLFIRLQKLSPADSPKQIRNNIEKLQIIQKAFKTIHPLLVSIKLNDKTIQYFGEFMVRSKSWNIVRKEEIDRYFHLATFCVYQRYMFEDWMARTFLSVCKTAKNKAISKEKERLFQQRKQRKKVLKAAIQLAENKTELLEKIEQLAWMNIAAPEKEKRLQALFPPQASSHQSPTLQQIKQEQQSFGDDDYYTYLQAQSQSLQQRASPIIKKITFKTNSSNTSLIKAIQHFRAKDGIISKNAPTDFLSDDDKAALIDKNGKFSVSLYKILLFQGVSDALERGGLDLQYSYKYKTIDNFLIPKNAWNKDPNSFLDKANLKHLKDVKNRISDYKTMLHHHFKQTNENILNGQNKYFRKSKNNNYYVITPKVEKEEPDISLFPPVASIPISEVLTTIDTITNFLEHFEHKQTLYRKKRPNKSTFFAVIMAFGCNLGVPAMAKATASISQNQLETISNWYLDLENIQKANDAITNFSNQLPLANLHRKKQGELRTSSDGQKIKVISNHTIFANYSAKYFRKGKGIVSYTFVDERYIPFYSTIIDSSIREATFVLDGLLHNEAIKSDFHTTDTHGYTEVLFGLMDLLGFGFNPNIAKMLGETIYTTKDNKITDYAKKGYLVLPKAYIKELRIEDNWMEMLRLVTSLKLKYCKASDIFTRFNSYSKQHPLYGAFKNYGRMPKTIHILRNTDDVERRQEGRKSANAIEASNRLSSAIFFAHGGETIFLTRTEQLIADACKNLIKNTIICWNYLYLTRRIQQAKTPQEAQQLIETIKHKTVNTWQHLLLSGKYDFSIENSADSYNLLRSQNFELNFD